MKRTTSEDNLAEQISRLTHEIHDLRSQVAFKDLQLQWFKKQIFGEKSERAKVVVGSHQTSFPFYNSGKSPNESEQQQSDPATGKKSPHKKRGGSRKKKPLKGDCGTSGIRFGEGVEIQCIDHIPEELRDLPKDRYVVIVTM
jgi:hypothetical protein